jgi:hypothetical protein
MARKLRTFQTSLGFFDQAIAAPSMKAALEAWGADSNLFHQGAASETDDPKIVAATMAKPGVVLKRPVGTNRPFSEHSDLPVELGRGRKPSEPARKTATRKSAKHAGRPIDSAAERCLSVSPNIGKDIIHSKDQIKAAGTMTEGVFRAESPAAKAAAAYEREMKRREREWAKEEAAAEKKRERRQKGIDKAQAAFDAAESEHADRAAAIEAKREAIERKSEGEDARWDKERAKLQSALKRARG